jgi:hypothetical protein
MEHNFRTSQINERYYALNNCPTFNQFVGRYEYVDPEGRQYIVARQHDPQASPAYENLKFDWRPEWQQQQGALALPVKNNQGHTKLFCKLAQTEQHWFSPLQMHQTLELQPVHNRQQTLRCRLESEYKPNHRRRTGILWVSGLHVV